MSEFTPQQQAAITGTGNLLVVAGAGTGKTRTLVGRCLRLVAEEHVSLENILMVTFTEAAAAEMRGRLRGKLRELQSAQPDDEHLAQQLALLDTARISTLHSFCLQLAREHFHELGLDPQFSVLDEEQTRPLQREALDELLEHHYVGTDEVSRNVRDLIRVVGRGSDHRIRQLVTTLHAYTQALPGPDRWLEEQLRRGAQAEPLEWRAAFLEAVAAWRDDWIDELRSSDNEVPAVQQCLDVLQNLSASATAAEAARGLQQVLFADDDENWPYGSKGKVRDPLRRFFEEAEFLGALLPDAKGNDPLAQDWEWSRHLVAALVSLTREFTAEFSARKRELGGVDFSDLEQCALRLLRDGDTGAPTATARTWRERLAHIFVDEYQDINEAQEAILVALGRDGPEANRFIVGDVKQSIYRFRLANPKIFQRYQSEWSSPADLRVAVPSLDSRKTGRRRKSNADLLTPLLPGFGLEPAEASPVRTGVAGGGRTFRLSENFRSRGALLNFINPLFAGLMREDIGGVNYEPLEFGAPEKRAALAATHDTSPRVEFHLIARGETPTEADDPDEDVAAPDLLAVEREARLVARRLRELKESEHPIWDDKLAAFRPVEWRDMAVLMRSPKGRAEAFAMEFSKAGVPLATARDGFFASLEVADLLNLLKLLDNPLQDIPLLAVLRSPLVGMSLDELAEVRAASNLKPFWTALGKTSNIEGPASGTKAKVEVFLAQFARWRELVRHTSLSQCLETALNETHYEALLLAGERGGEHVANVRRLLDLARQFDPYQRQGLYRFLRFVQAQEDGELDLPATAPPTGNAVQLLSIHRSKGLEFPVVVLAGLGTRFNEQDLHGSILLHEKLGLCPKITPPGADQSYPGLTHWLARRAERRELRGEELRLFYVALTRARDALILVGTTNLKTDAAKWASGPPAPLATNQISDARSHLDWLRMWLPLATADDEWRDERSGANQLLQWQIHDEHDDHFADTSSTRGERVYETNEPPEDAATAVAALITRLARPYPSEWATTQAAKTSVSDLRRRAADDTDNEVRQLFQANIRRPKPGDIGRQTKPGLSAAEVGTAHHTFLQFVELARTGDTAELQSEADRLRQAGVLAPEQVAALDFATIAQFWQSEAGRRIRAKAGHVRRELKFTARFAPSELDEVTRAAGTQPFEDEFVVVQGVADLVVLLPKEIWLLDFKTDAVRTDGVADRSTFHEPQLKLYALALNRIYRKPVTRCWLHFLACGMTAKMEL